MIRFGRRGLVELLLRLGSRDVGWSTSSGVGVREGRPEPEPRDGCVSLSPLSVLLRASPSSADADLEETQPKEPDLAAGVWAGLTDVDLTAIGRFTEAPTPPNRPAEAEGVAVRRKGGTLEVGGTRVVLSFNVLSIWGDASARNLQTKNKKGSP